MNILSRSSRIALAVVGHLAEIWDEPDRRLTSAEIAQSRRLPQPFVAKVLTQLSRVGLVESVTGPRGGCRLARAPRDITLLEVVQPFEREDELYACPYGPNWCGVGAKCPLHDQIVSHQEAVGAWLTETTLEGFRTSHKGGSPAAG